MSNITVLKTQSLLQSPKIGFDKLIVNFPNGATTTAGTNGKGLYIDRVADINPVKILKPVTVLIYNGSLLNYDGNNIETLLDEQYIDEYGNVIKKYILPTSYKSTKAYVWQAVTNGTTRIEILDYSSNCVSAYYGADAASNKTTPEGSIDILQYVLLPNNKVECKSNGSIGDLSLFKERGDLTSVILNGTAVTGNINNFVKAAANNLICLAFPYCTDVYGELTELLDAMKVRDDVKGQTYSWYFYNTMVTYKGNLINQGGARTIAFDNEGNYTVDGV